MKTLFFILLSLSLIFFMFGCEKKPTVPELTQIDETIDAPTSLAKKTVGAFRANADDWFVRSEEYGEYTFAQFDVDGSDADVTVLPNGNVLLKDRKLSSPLRQDESGSCNFLNNNSEDNWAIILVISAEMKSEAEELIGGPAHGTISITGTWEGLTGTFEGRFSGFFSDDRGNDYFDGRFDAKGTAGDFVGMLMKGTMQEISPTIPDTGPDFILKGTIKSN